MVSNLPDWAKMKVTSGQPDFGEVRQAYQQDRVLVQWPDLSGLKRWAKAQGWPVPWFGFKEAFLTKMFETDANYAAAMETSGIVLVVPISEYVVTAHNLAALDALYEQRGDSGRPNGWGSLVAELRQIRRLVEAGVEVKIEGTSTVLTTWQSFYDWAHGRYHMLEDGYDSWIGDDLS